MPVNKGESAKFDNGTETGRAAADYGDLDALSYGFIRGLHDGLGREGIRQLQTE